MNKRTLLIAGTACVLAVALFFGFKIYSEATMRNNIETFLANLPAPLKVEAETIETSMFSKSVTLTNLKGTYAVTIKQTNTEEIIPMNFSIERIDATGLNMNGFKPGAGVARLFDSLAFRNMAVNSPMSKVNIALYHLEDVSGDAEKLARELSKTLPSFMAANASANFPGNNAERKKALTDLGSLLRAYETIHVGRLTCEKYTNILESDSGRFDLDIGMAKFNDYSIRKMGPFSIDKLNMAVDGSPLMTLERISADGLVLPSFVAFFDSIAASDLPLPLMLQSAFADQVFSLQNLQLKDLTLLRPKEKDETAFSLAELIFSYTSETDHVMDLIFNSLNFQKSLFLEESNLQPEAFVSLPETISLEGGWQQTITPRGHGAFDLNCKKISLKGPGLGETSVSIALDYLNIGALMLGSPGNASLRSFDFAVRDDGLFDVVFALNGLPEGKTAEQARADEVASLRQEKESNPIDKELLNGIIGFLEKPGSSLRIVLAPAEPLNINRLASSSMLTEPAAIGLTVSFEQPD